MGKILARMATIQEEQQPVTVLCPIDDAVECDLSALIVTFSDTTIIIQVNKQGGFSIGTTEDVIPAIVTLQELYAWAKNQHTQKQECSGLLQ